jgi:hypothetical protein
VVIENSLSRSNAVINESYSLPGRKKAVYRDSANEAVLRLSRGGQELHLAVRAYDDGIAYRYRIPGTGRRGGIRPVLAAGGSCWPRAASVGV